MKGLRKRICSIMLTFFLVASPVLSPSITVQAFAPAVVIGAKTLAEVALVLYGVVKSGMIVSGIAEGIDDVQDGATVGEAFRTFLGTATGNSYNWAKDYILKTYNDEYITFAGSETYELEMTDGEKYVVTGEQVKDFITQGDIDWSVSESAVPKEEEWEDFKQDYAEQADIIYHDWAQADTGGGSGGDDEDPDDEDPDRIPGLTKIKEFSIGAGMLTAVEDFALRMLNNQVEGLDLEDYGLEPYYFDGEYDVDIAGNYVYKGLTKYNSTIYDIYVDSAAEKVCGFYHQDNSLLYVVHLTSSNNNIGCSYNDITYFNRKTGVSQTSKSVKCDGRFSCNFPIFSTTEQCKNYLTKGSTTGLLNSSPYNYHALVDSVPEVLTPYTGVSIPANQLPAINNALQNAVPEPVPDAAANTEAYKQTMNETLQQVLPEASPAPSPEPAPEPEPEPAPEGSVEITPELQDYKVDLTNIFPFCLPFDFIALLEVLSAEPETPKFNFPFVVQSIGVNETIVIDLSFLDSVMDGLRKLELLTYIGVLIFATGKVIKW